MLSTIREKTQGWIAFLLLGVITVPFALWGISSYFGNAVSTNVARVNGIPITAAQYQQAVRQTEQEYEQMLGRKVDPGLFDTPEFKKAALEPLIDRTLLIQNLEGAGFVVPDQELGAVIRHMTAFRNHGHFDPAQYRTVLADNAYTIDSFEATMRTNVLVEQLQQGLIASGFVPTSQLNGVLRLEGEQRQIAYRAFLPAAFAAAVKVTPAAIAAYYAAHQTDYTTPEQLRLAYLELSPAVLADRVQVPEATLRAAYQQHLQEFAVPAEQRVRHILIAVPAGAPATQQAQALAKAQMIEAKLRAGAAFAAMARAYSDDAGSAKLGGDLGIIRSGTMPASFDAALKTLKVGAISPPVRTRYGYHIIQLTALKPGGIKPFHLVRPLLQKMAERQYASKKLSGLADRLRRLVYQHPHHLTAAAQALGLSVQQTGWFNKGTVGTGLAADPLVLKAASSDAVLHQGRNSSVLRLAHHTYVAVRLAGRHPAVIVPLAQVQDSIQTTLTAQGAEKAAEQAAEQARLQAERPGAAALKGWTKPAPFSREAVGTLDPKLAQAVFAAPKPIPGHSSVAVTALATGGYAAFSVLEVTPGDPAAVGVAARGEIRSSLQAENATDLYQDYLAGLRKRAKIRIYQKNL